MTTVRLLSVRLPVTLALVAAVVAVGELLVPAGAQRLYIDAAKVERIVENLLANAIKHTPPGTDVLARVEQGDGFVLIAVDDRGYGIEEADREAVFELFTRGYSHGGVPGAGIGLSLVAQFAAVHGGRAWIEDHPGGGASFRVRLPLHQAAGSANARGRSISEAAPARPSGSASA